MRVLRRRCLRLLCPCGRPGLAAALLLLALADTTHAYVRMTTPGGVPLRWTQSCVLLSPSERPAPGLGLLEEVEALTRATENWNQKGEGCSALALHARPAGPRRAGSDGVSAVLFLEGRWGRGQVQYDPSAAAVTTVVYLSRPGRSEDGTITDADIELNAVDFRFAILDPQGPTTPRAPPGQRLADLENTLTHELGHVLGLGHNCWDRQTPKPPLTDDGVPAPPCDGPLPETILRATMFPYAGEGETSKRRLAEDDLRGLCGSYPAEQPLTPCEQTVQGGCVMGRGGSGGAGALTLALALVMALLNSRAQGRNLPREDVQDHRRCCLQYSERAGAPRPQQRKARRRRRAGARRKGARRRRACIGSDGHGRV